MCTCALLLLLFGCGKSLPDLQGFDRVAWMRDFNACTGYRTSIDSLITVQKDKLLALNEMQVIEVLGKPDQRELYKRNQKFYYYFLEASPECKKIVESPRRLILRFNATNLVNEVSVE